MQEIHLPAARYLRVNRGADGVVDFGVDNTVAVRMTGNVADFAFYEDARAVADLVEEKFPKLDGKVLINNIGGLIGAHTGPGTVALFFWGGERVD